MVYIECHMDPNISKATTVRERVVVLKAPAGKYFSKMKAQYSMFVDVVVSKQVCVSIICMTLHYAQLCQTQLITLCAHHRFDDEVKDDAHGAFTPK